jgi:hypothetical protein
MFLHVGAIPGGAPVQFHLAQKAGFGQSIQAIVNGGHGDVGHFRLGMDEDLVGRGMIQLVSDHVIDMLTLGREPKPAMGEALIQMRIKRRFGFHRFL